MITRLASVLLLAALAACATVPPAAPPKIDGSSPAAFEASWKALVATLNSEQQAKLNTAILLIGATKFRNSEVNQFGPETLRNDLDGKTYDEIIKAGAATGATIGGVEHHHNAL